MLATRTDTPLPGLSFNTRLGKVRLAQICGAAALGTHLTLLLTDHSKPLANNIMLACHSSWAAFLAARYCLSPKTFDRLLTQVQSCVQKRRPSPAGTTPPLHLTDGLQMLGTGIVSGAITLSAVGDRAAPTPASLVGGIVLLAALYSRDFQNDWGDAQTEHLQRHAGKYTALSLALGAGSVYYGEAVGKIVRLGATLVIANQLQRLIRKNKGAIFSCIRDAATACNQFRIAHQNVLGRIADIGLFGLLTSRMAVRTKKHIVPLVSLIGNTVYHSKTIRKIALTGAAIITANKLRLFIQSQKKAVSDCFEHIQQSGYSIRPA